MTANSKPLSEKPLGYLLAVVGGLLGGPLGLIVSPAVLFGLGKIMKGQGDKKPNRFLAWAAIGIVGAPLCFAPIVSNSDIASNQPTTSDTSSSESRSSSKTSVIPLGLKESVRDDRALQVTGSREYSSISVSNQFFDPVTSKGGRLVAVFMTIENTGKESGNMFWTDMRLKDSEGRAYDSIEDFTEIMTINAWAEEQGLDDAGDQLFPGATANTVSVFRVAPDAAGLQLDVNQKALFAIE